MAKSTKGFDKFINKPVKGAKIKEAIRQEKKAAVKERREAIERHFEQKRQQKQAAIEQRQQSGPTASKPVSAKKSTGPRAKSGGSKVGKSWDKSKAAPAPTGQPIPAKATPAAPRSLAPGKKPYGKPQEKSNATPSAAPRSLASGKKPYGKPQEKSNATPSAAPRSLAPGKKPYGKPQEKSNTTPSATPRSLTPGKKPYDKPQEKSRDTSSATRPTKTVAGKPGRTTPAADKPSPLSKGRPASPPKAAGETKPAAVSRNIQPPKESKPVQPAAAGRPPAAKPADRSAATPIGPMPLNKFLAHAGICSRRDAAEKVKQGHASVNGQTITEPAFKVSDTDVVKFDGKPIQRSRNFVYILLNKPKDTITTAEDPQGRKTVMDIIRPATQERVYPVGRLDRNTSGVLLLTNDGDLAQQLSHPSFEVRKIYEVRLDKPLVKGDFDKILNGLTLEDGAIHADSLAYADPKDKTIVGIEIHSGRNRIVRRLFEHLGYDVRNLDRVMYANLTKKNVERGHWRHLTEKEVRLLKYFNKSKKTTA